MNFPRLRGWFGERYDVTDVAAAVRKKPVPVHSRELWYYTGGIVLFLFIIQFSQGIALAFYYIPYFEQPTRASSIS